MISPTGHNIRGADKHGSGAYGSGRGDRLHAGADYVCMPGQGVVSPVDGTIIRIARPYGDEYSGVVIRSSKIEIKMFYFEPSPELIGCKVNKGEIIGHAQDISKKYPGMIPHIHLQIDSIDPELLINIP